MNDYKDPDLDLKMETLLQDPNFAKRIAGNIIQKEENRKKIFPSNRFVLQALAAALLLGISSLIATFYIRSEKESKDSYSNYQNSAEFLASPLETEHIWEGTDLIIETSFTQR
ncbi:hypothetical protein [Leptospira sarikeiensis]|nr:hypothetical protein [Leptospira sarikeiensis]